MGPGEAGRAVALPDDEYLLRLGKVAYSVGSVEWTVCPGWQAACLRA